MKIKLALADVDSEYVERFIDIIKGEDNIMVSAFTDKEALAAAIQSHSFDILLFSPNIDITGINLKKVAISILLYDDNDYSEIENYEKYPKINKYQRGTSIINKMLDMYSDVSNSAFFGGSGSSRAVSISVYSPVGGSGKTTIALSLATLIANRGYRVMYLNFETISSYGAYLKQDGGKNMGEIIAGFDKKINIPLKLKSIIKTDPRGIMYFEEFSSIFDMEDITDEDIEKLVNAVADADICDYIIIDMDSVFDRKTRKVIEISNYNVIVSANAGFGSHKLHKFIEQYQRDADIMSKMYVINNFGNANPDTNTLISLGTIPYLNGYPFDKSIEHICKNIGLTVDVLLR